MRTFNRKLENKWTYGSYSSVLLYLAFAPKSLLIPCPFLSFFGIYCPACGGTRALRALITGEFSLALHENALVSLLPVLMGFWILLKMKVKSRSILFAYSILIVVAAITFTVFRNQAGSPLAPFGKI